MPEITRNSLQHNCHVLAYGLANVRQPPLGFISCSAGVVHEVFHCGHSENCDLGSMATVGWYGLASLRSAVLEQSPEIVDAPERRNAGPSRWVHKINDMSKIDHTTSSL